MSFTPYSAPERGDFGDFKPSEHIDTPIIVKVVDHQQMGPTTYKPEGGPGVFVDVCDFSNGNVQRNVLWMNGALVDGLKQYVGQTLVIRLEYVESKAGRKYVSIAQASDKEITAAEAYVKQFGDPFAPALATVKGDDVPF